jgi:hypothetical protein
MFFSLLVRISLNILMMHNEHSLIWALYLEGAAEDMIMSSLRKQQATPEEVSMFTRKESGKLLFS